MSTYDDHREHLIVQYTEPVKSTRTTHDIAMERLTVEAPPTEIGQTQNYAGRDYIFTGSEWILLEDHEE
jgi:hypothetical protein